METTTEKETKKSNSLFECNEVESVKFRFNKEFSYGEKPWIVEHKNVEHTVDEVVSHIGFITKGVRIQKGTIITCGVEKPNYITKFVAESMGKLSILEDAETGKTKAVIYY